MAPVAINAVSPSSLQAITPEGANPVVLTGCGFANTQLVSVGSNLLFPGTGVTIVDDNTLVFDFPEPDFLGPNHPIAVNIGGGQVAQATIAVTADPPVLQNLNKNLGGPFVPSLKVASSAGDLFFLVSSPHLAPSELPGLYAFDIGLANTSLFLAAVGTVEGDGVSLVHLPKLQLPLGFPVGVNIHFQAGLLDGASGALPLEPTNFVTSVSILH